MPHNTRQNIIHILEQKENATAHELSRILKVTQSNIRHHLSILIDQGSVKIAGFRNLQQRGRPSAIYALAQSSYNDNLDILSDVLLTKVLDGFSHSVHEDTLKWLAKNLVAKYPQSSHNPTQRLYSTIQTLSKINYHAQWEAHVDTPRIMFGHCPYVAILENHPEMCQVDTYLIELLTGSPAQLVAKRVLTPDGHRQCVFRLNKK